MSEALSTFRKVKRTVGISITRVAEIAAMPIKAALTSCVQTDKRRWRKVATQIPPWDERNRMIASLIPKESSVVDLGSGGMTLKQYLKPGCEYQPCDVVQAVPEVLLCDFNAGIYPALRKKYDYVVCSGILEYMRDPKDFLSRVADYGSSVILSYNPIGENETKISRLGKGWVNHFSQSELEELFGSAHLQFEMLFRRDVSEITYRLCLNESALAA